MGAGFCCNDYTIGSNQMVSCAQACMMRMRGTPRHELLSSLGGLCARTGSSGCELQVNGYGYSFCGTCKDLTPVASCQHGVADHGACDFGSSLELPGMTAATTAQP